MSGATDLGAPPARDTFPRAALFATGGLIALTLLLVAVAPLSGRVPAGEPGDVLATRAMYFEDRPDGAIAVSDVGAAQPFVVLDPGTNGFIRATLRGLARERRASGFGAETPFRVTAWANGRVTLEDPQTGRRVDLAAFGPTQVEAFARLLPPHGVTR